MENYNNTKENLYEQEKPKQVVAIVLPIGIPGMGKTYFRDRFKSFAINSGCTFDYVSSEDIRGTLISQHQNKTMQAREEELNPKALFDETRDSFNYEFAKSLKKKLRHAN